MAKMSESVMPVQFAGGPTWSVASAWRAGEPVWRGTVDGRAVALQVRGMLNGVALTLAGTAAAARVYTIREAELAALMPEKTAGGSGKQVLCPMPGLVKAILVASGQEVKAGEPLAIVEAMKMENVLRAERDATIAKVLAREGESLAVISKGKALYVADNKGNTARITIANVKQSNGVIHVIDKVEMP